MNAIEASVASIKEGRADYLWNTKAAAAALGIAPTKFGDWWYRTQRKLILLYAAFPGETSAELAALFARAEAHRQTPNQRRNA